MFGIAIRPSYVITSAVCALLLAACVDTAVNTRPSVPGGAGLTDGKGQIALLLPYGDDNYQAMTSSMENSARLALADLGADGLEIQTYDTNGDLEGAVAATQTAVADGADVILGPVFGQYAVHAAPFAAAAEVPMISFSNDPSIVNANLVIIGHTFKNSAKRIMQYAAQQEYSNVLIVHAQNAQGLAGLTAIESAAAESGVNVAGSLSYEFTQKGVVDAIPLIVDAVRQNDADLILFTADTAGALPLLGQLLPEAGIDIESVKFAGLTRWDIPNSSLQNQGLQGGWFPLPDPNLAASFSFRYQYVYQSVPHPNSGLAYDGVLVAHALLTAAGKSSVASSLADQNEFKGATGLFRFQSDGQIERSLAVAEIQNSRAEVVSQAPRAF